LTIYLKDYEKSDWVIGNILRDKSERLGDKVFFRTKDQIVTYNEMNATCCSFANGFLELGLHKGDKVCIMLDNCLEHLYCWFGLGKAGLVDVPINTAYKGQILEHIINNSEATAIIIDQAYVERIMFVIENIKSLKYLIVYCPPGVEKVNFELPIRILDLNDFFSFSTSEPDTNIHHSDLATIIYTSGTSGPSKGVMMSHAFCYSFGRVTGGNLGLLPEDIDYTCLPMFHANARLLCTYPCLLAGAQVAMARRFSVSRFWQDINFFGATVFNCLGAMAPLLLKNSSDPYVENNPVRLAFLIPTPEPYKEFEQRFNLKIITSYGMTEVNMPIFSSPDLEFPEKSCGKGVPGFELAIVNEYDQEVPDGEIGELVVRPSTAYTIMSGYYNLPEKTLEAFRNLWFHTGDALYRDKDGWYFFIDRIKDAIRRRGENISSYEVETIINTHSAVLESAVIAIKDSVFTEDEVKACLVLKPGEQLTPEKLIDYCRPRMPYFYIPRYIEIMDSFPKTPTGKIQKAVLRERGITANTWDLEKAGIKR
jgi:crotonobetaine/carnitine-CoA ligase